MKVGWWRWPHWVLLTLVVLYGASYLGLMSFMDRMLNALAGDPKVTASVYRDTLQGEALVLVFAFMLLTPLALALALAVPLILSGAFAAVLNRATNIPVMVGTLAFWVALGVVAFIFREHWYPQAQWFVNVMARGFIIALQRA
ncbi:MAG TPA: hypothetical protein VID04_09605 [Methylomirabilota bacterium]|jgi:hypothetical protein